MFISLACSKALQAACGTENHVGFKHKGNDYSMQRNANIVFDLYHCFYWLCYILFILRNHKDCGSRYRKDCGLRVLDYRKDSGLFSEGFYYL